MDRRAFLESIGKGTVSGAYLLHGTEETLKTDALNALRKALLPEGFEQLNYEELEKPEADAIISACETLPFMADRRLVLVREQPGFAGKGGDPADSLLAYLPHVPTSTVLVFFHRGKADGKRKLTAAIKKSGTEVLIDQLKGDDLNAYAVTCAEECGCGLDPVTASKLVFTCGDDAGILEQEIRKLAAAAGPGSAITPALIDALATRSLECRVFDMINAMLAGNRTGAFRLLEDLLKNGEDRLGILAMLLRQYRMMQHVKIMQYEKVPGPEIVQRLGYTGKTAWMGNQLLKQTQKLGNKQIREAVNICLDTELKVKSGRMNDEGSVESAMLRIFALNG